MGPFYPSNVVCLSAQRLLLFVSLFFFSFLVGLILWYNSFLLEKVFFAMFCSVAVGACTT